MILKRSLNILAISHMYPNSQNPMLGIFVKRQLINLKKDGHKVKVIAPVPYAPKFLSRFKKKWAQYSKIEKRVSMKESR